MTKTIIDQGHTTMTIMTIFPTMIQSHLVMGPPFKTCTPSPITMASLWVTTTVTTSTAIMLSVALEMFLVTGDTTTDRLKLWRWETRELVVLLSLESSTGKVFDKNSLDTGCRYFSTSGRTDSVADIGSKGWSEFRHYNYGAVPYFGSSDNYHNLNKMLRNQNWKEGRTF